MNKKLVISNWKMLPESLAQARELLDFTNNYLDTLNENKEFSMVFCPPFVFTEEVAKMLKLGHFEHQAALGAQDIAVEDKAALTGEISGPMLIKLGVEYVIIGHSERRWKLGESDDVVNKKLKSALRNDLIPIVCIGEVERDGDFQMFLEQQVKRTFNGLSGDEVGKCIIAYEPVWAISTNPNARPDTPGSALESIKIIKDCVTKNYEPQTAPVFLYGGSVNPQNVGDFLKEQEINGVLVGGASVKKNDFVRILEAVSKL